MTDAQWQLLGEAVGRAVGSNSANTTQKLFLESANPDEWLTFKSQFRLMLEGKTGWNEARKKRELRLALKGEALEAVKEIKLTEDADPEVPSCEALLAQYERRFVTERHSDWARVAYKEARQLPDEGLIPWSVRLRGLYVRATGQDNPDVDQGMPGRDLREKFMTGLRDERVKIQVLLRKPPTYQECLEAAESVAAALVMHDTTSTGRRSNHTLSAMGMGTGGGEGGRGDPDQPGVHSFNGNCRFCQQYGHMERNCNQLRKARNYLEDKKAARQGGQAPRSGPSQPGQPAGPAAQPAGPAGNAGAGGGGGGRRRKQKKKFGLNSLGTTGEEPGSGAAPADNSTAGSTPISRDQKDQTNGHRGN